jgi:hypothetical protein
MRSAPIFATVKDGQRAIGTQMDNPQVIEAVLQQGKPFQNINTIRDF